MSNTLENDVYKALTYSKFCDLHETQLKASGVPERYWQTLHTKLQRQVYDAGEVFQLLKVEEDLTDEGGGILNSWQVVVTQKQDIDLHDPRHIYIIDHAWTYQSSEARGQLMDIPGLVERMAVLMDITVERHDQMVEAVLRDMWKFNQTYSLMEKGVDRVSYWYVMDEFGSRIQHSDTPSFKTSPLMYLPLGISFTLMWPLQNTGSGDEVTRDYVGSLYDSSKRAVRLLPWIPRDMSDLSYALSEPNDEYFKAYMGDETIPETTTPITPITDRSLRLYVDVSTFRDHLTHPRFKFVDDPQDADVIWSLSHWKDFRQLSECRPTRLINQFPGEFVLTMKDLLAIVSRRAANDDETPPWLPTTYNLTTQIVQFVSFFQNNENIGEYNFWIIKPYNKSRGLDIHVTDNLNEILRLPDTGPQVACKYVDTPVLFYRSDVAALVKFDLRYIVVLHTVKPLKLSVYNMFWLRFANKEFSLDHFDDYEKHFTVMNYIKGTELKQMMYTDFIEEFNKQNPSYSWASVQSNIHEMFRQLFHAATSQPYPRGLHDNPGSRAMYGIDLMLQWNTSIPGERTIQPVLCEVNFSPDCTRACDYEPAFANDMFAAMFLGDVNERFTTLT